MGELDRVLGGGVVPGSVTLLAGDPGVGKSTLLLKVAHRWAQRGRRTLYISGEESAGQIRLRADRIGCGGDEVYLAAESDLHTVLDHIAAVRPALVVVDSVQTMSTTEADGVAGGVTQVRAVTAALTAAAKANNVALILVGHVTKDGAIAGPRSLEHLVDVVLHFEGDRNGSVRMVRGIKNRFGTADEVGCFMLHDNGIEDVADPSHLFLDQRDDHRRAGKAQPVGHRRQRHLPLHRRRHAVDRFVRGSRRRDSAGFGVRESAAAQHRGGDR
jgi:DNA repair protein RadA/Sms